MAVQHITASARVNAAPSRVYGIIANYRTEHPRILPPAFLDLVVEQGGVGAGTTFRCSMRLMGSTQTFRAQVTEPDPGRVLVETSIEGQHVVTTFTVTPMDGGQACDVTIASDFTLSAGLRGKIERWFIGRLMPPIYKEELVKLAHVASSPSA